MQRLTSFSITKKAILITSFSALSLLANTSTQAATISNLYNTGVSDSSSLLGGGILDPHYTLTSQPSPGGSQAVTLASIDHTYVPNSGTSRWIGPNVGDLSGDYIYQTTFTLPTDTNLSTVSINGLWSADNSGLDILINGISTSNVTSGGIYSVDYSFRSLSNFTINKGFQIGSNTLGFKLNNGGSVTGLRVEGIQGTYNVVGSAVPEPLTILGAMTAAGFGAGFKRKLTDSQKVKTKILIPNLNLAV
jgi:hypothetical protein